MTETEIREIVKMTIEELTARQSESLTYQDILRVMDKKLYGYFEKPNDRKIGESLTHYNGDPYIDIIYYQYASKMTIEQIAETMSKDVSTIKRNKKRIITKMYEELYR